MLGCPILLLLLIRILVVLLVLLRICLLVDLRVIICVVLVSAPILGVLHIVFIFSGDLYKYYSAYAYIENGQLNFEGNVEGLLAVRPHLKVAIDQLAFVHSQGFLKEEPCLVPVGGWCGRTCLQCYVLLRTFKDCIEVDGVAVY